jgi:hypothetical protein
LLLFILKPHALYVFGVLPEIMTSFGSAVWHELILEPFERSIFPSLQLTWRCPIVFIKQSKEILMAKLPS